MAARHRAAGAAGPPQKPGTPAARAAGWLPMVLQLASKDAQ
jgi:hypothetical protein